jgi:hypothetical protein
VKRVSRASPHLKSTLYYWDTLPLAIVAFGNELRRSRPLELISIYTTTGAAAAMFTWFVLLEDWPAL